MDWLDRYRLLLSVRIATWRMMARKRAAWQPHLAASQAFIIEAMAGARKGRAVILGSGPLFDVPLEALSAAFTEVLLVDLYHPFPARWRARKLSNVRFLSRDVSGITVDVATAARTGGALPPYHTDLDMQPGDFVVSLNLLSQIPNLPEAFLAHYGRENDAYLRALVEAHLAWLHGLDGTVCALFDVERQHNKGSILEVMDLLHGTTPPAADKEWTWAIEPGVIHTIRACRFA